jgi:selenocysteine lyase/cysteine desulfurase
MADQFSLDPDRVWLNASHQGPLPNVAAAAVAEMVRWKQQPFKMSTPEPFTNVPERLRTELAGLLGVAAERIALANSSSYGIHLVANGLGLGAGDEVIVARNDFPSDVLPFLSLEPQGVVVKQLEPAGQVLTVDEISAEFTPRTRVVCLTWVHSFSGHVVDLDAIGELCRARGVLFVVNGSQGVGGIPIQPGDGPIDVLAGVGFKYLCGPYGTGFCWIADAAMERITTNKLYWLSALTADDLAQEALDLDHIEAPLTAAKHDVFGTANFFNFSALAASVELVTSTGVDRIYDHNMALSEALVEGIDPAIYEVQNRGDEARRSAILFLQPLTRSLEELGEHLVESGIDVARRRGMIRIAPHFYNSAEDVDRALAVLDQLW